MKKVFNFFFLFRRRKGITKYRSKGLRSYKQSENVVPFISKYSVFDIFQLLKVLA